MPKEKGNIQGRPLVVGEQELHHDFSEQQVEILQYGDLSIYFDDHNYQT